MSGIMDKLRHKQHTTPATANHAQQPHLMQQQQSGFMQPGITQQSSIVHQPGFAQEQPLQTTHMAAPIVQETIRNDRVVEVQPIIHREVDKNVVHHIEKHIQEAHAPNMGGVVERPAIVQQEIHTNVINEIHPIIHRERVVPVMERAEEHLTQRVVEPTIHTHEVTYENASSSSLYGTQQYAQSSSMLPGQSSSFQHQQQQIPFQHGISSTQQHGVLPPLAGQSSSFQQQQIPLQQQQQIPLQQQQQFPLQQQQQFPLQQQQQLPLQQGAGAMAAGLVADSILNKQQQPHSQQQLPLSQQQPLSQLQQALPHQQQPLSQQQQQPLSQIQQTLAQPISQLSQQQHPLPQQQAPLSQIQQTLAQPISQLSQQQHPLPQQQAPLSQLQQNLSQQPLAQQNLAQPLSQQPLSTQQPSLGQGIVKGMENQVLNSMGSKSNTAPLSTTANQQSIGRQGF